MFSTAHFIMALEQRTNLKFLVRLGKSPTEAFKMLQLVYGDETMARSSVFEWHKRFRDGREEVEDAARSGRPSTSRTEENVDRVRQMIRNDRRLTVRMIADSLSINRDCVWKIITEDLGMRKICAKMVPKLLNDAQKERRVQVCEDIIERLETEPNLLAKVITGDESWVFEYDPETKRQSCQWKSPGSPRPQKARQRNSLSIVELTKNSSTSKELSTLNSYRKVKRSTSMSTKRSYDVCSDQCVRRGETCGWTTRGRFIMTTRRLTTL